MSDAQAEPDTRTRLLDAAEELFAERGWSGASMRELTSRAGANLAAVGYHFGGKEELFHEVVLRRIKAVNEIRLTRLDELEAEVGQPTVDQLVSAFVDPVLECSEGPRGEHFLRLVARTHGDPDGPWRAAVARAPFAEVLGRFARALGAAAPHLSAEDVGWRLHLMVGALVHTLMHREAACAHGDMPFAPALSNSEALRAQLVAFLSGGLAAPPAAPPDGDEHRAAPCDSPQRTQ